jgi:hypothetical protein
MDLSAKVEISGQVGQKWSWQSEIIGSGSLTTQEILPSKYIESKLEYTAPRAMQSKDIRKF